MKDWKALQFDLYRSLKVEAQSRLAKVSLSFQRYESHYKKDLRHLQSSSSSELVRSINASDCLIVGDFHTLRQSQRFLIRLLRDRRIRKPEFLGLEILSKSALPLIDRWLNNPSIKNQRLLQESLLLEKAWGSHWESYKDLFILCHQEKIKLLPLFSPLKKLHQRDLSFARNIASTEGKVWALLGEFHCARPHVPQLILKSKLKKKVTVIQQNNDEAMEKLFNTALNKDPVLVLKSKPHAIDLFCVLHTPLWIKYQSLLEHSLQTDEKDSGEITDPTDQIKWSLQTLTNFLKDPRYPERKNTSSLFQFHVFKAEDPLFYRTLLKLSKDDKKSVIEQLRGSGIALYQPKRILFLSEVTINSCSQAAALYLYHMWSGAHFDRNVFYKMALSECLVFFLSKLLNHSRRAPSLSTFSTSKADLEKHLNHVSIYPPHQSQYWLKKLKSDRHLIAMTFGRIWADRLFEAFLTGEFSKPRLIRILKTTPTSENHAFMIISEIASVGLSFAHRSRRVW